MPGNPSALPVHPPSRDPLALARPAPPLAFLTLTALIALLFPLTLTLTLLAADRAYAQPSLRTPDRHGEYLGEAGYRSAFETCVSLQVRALDLVTEPEERKGVLAPPESDYPQPGAGPGEWAKAYRLLSVRFAVTLGPALPSRADAPLQGRYLLKADGGGEDGESPDGTLTVAAVADGPEYGVDITTVNSRLSVCSWRGLAGKPDGGRLTAAPEDPGSPAAEIAFRGDTAEAGPPEAFSDFCGVGAYAHGTYVRAR